MDIADGHLIWFVVFLILLAVDFILSAFAAGVQTISDTAMESAYEQSPNACKAVRSYHDNPSKLIRACWLYLILTAWPAALSAFSLSGWQRCVQAALSGILVYLFGRSIPKLFGKKYGLTLCMRLGRIVSLLTHISVILTTPLTILTNGFVRLFGIHPHALEDEVTEDEIISMVNEGHEQGVLDEHEAEMIQNIFELDTTQAQDIMTHRKNISALDGHVSLRDAIAHMAAEANSRFPIYEENIDNIIGVLHLKDAVIAQNKGNYDDWLIKDIPDLIRPVNFIPETRNIDDLFHFMQKEKMQMVIVVDEYGETAGLVTMEDILEEIVGNILDEYDEDTQDILPLPDGSFSMAGMAALEDVEQALHISFGTEDYDTLNGYLVFLLDRIPDESDHSVIYDHGWRFAIERVHSRMIQKVHVTKDTSAVPETDTNASV